MYCEAGAAASLGSRVRRKNTKTLKAAAGAEGSGRLGTLELQTGEEKKERKKVKAKGYYQCKSMESLVGRVGEQAPSIRGVKKKRKDRQWKLSSPLFVCVVGAGETKRTE